MKEIPAGCKCWWDRTESGDMNRVQSLIECRVNHQEPGSNDITAFGGITLPPLSELIGMNNG